MFTDCTVAYNRCEVTPQFGQTPNAMVGNNDLELTNRNGYFISKEFLPNDNSVCCPLLLVHVEIEGLTTAVEGQDRWLRLGRQS